MNMEFLWVFFLKKKKKNLILSCLVACSLEYVGAMQGFSTIDCVRSAGVQSYRYW